MSGLSERLKSEPEYRPYCLNCPTMMRMKLEPDGKTMWCEPVRDTTHDGLIAFGLPPVQRVGCGLRFDIETGERLHRANAAPPGKGDAATGELIMSYDYVQRAYGVQVRVGARVRHTETGRHGTIQPVATSALHYVSVLFDGDKFSRPSHPKALDYNPKKKAA